MYAFNGVPRQALSSIAAKLESTLNGNAPELGATLATTESALLEAAAAHTAALDQQATLNLPLKQLRELEIGTIRFSPSETLHLLVHLWFQSLLKLVALKFFLSEVKHPLSYMNDAITGCGTRSARRIFGGRTESANRGAGQLFERYLWLMKGS